MWPQRYWPEAYYPGQYWPDGSGPKDEGGTPPATPTFTGMLFWFRRRGRRASAIIALAILTRVLWA